MNKYTRLIYQLEQRVRNSVFPTPASKLNQADFWSADRRAEQSLNTFANTSRYRVVFDRRLRTTLGYVSFHRRQVRLNPDRIDSLLLLHEACHIRLGRRPPHKEHAPPFFMTLLTLTELFASHYTHFLLEELRALGTDRICLLEP